MKKYGQRRLDNGLRKHERWLALKGNGMRLIITGRDLSGLNFGINDLHGVDLSYSDISNADFSGCCLAAITLKNMVKKEGAKFPTGIRKPTYIT